VTSLQAAAAAAAAGDGDSFAVRRRPLAARNDYLPRGRVARSPRPDPARPFNCRPGSAATDRDIKALDLIAQCIAT